MENNCFAAKFRNTQFEGKIFKNLCSEATKKCMSAWTPARQGTDQCPSDGQSNGKLQRCPGAISGFTPGRNGLCVRFELW